MLDDEDEDARLSAVELLGRLSTPQIAAPRVLTPLLRVMADDEEGCVRMGAVGVIAQLPSELQARRRVCPLSRRATRGRGKKSAPRRTAQRADHGAPNRRRLRTFRH